VRVRVRIRVSRVTSEGGYPRRRASGGEMLQSWPRSFRSSARLFMNSPALRVELSPVCALIRSESEGDLVRVRVRVGVRVRVRVTRSRTVGERGRPGGAVRLRYRGDAAEMQGRYSGDAVEMQGRCSGDAWGAVRRYPSRPTCRTRGLASAKPSTLY